MPSEIERKFLLKDKKILDSFIEKYNIKQSYLAETKNQTTRVRLRKDGAEKEAGRLQIPFLGKIPIDKRLREQSDIGKPACIDEIDSEISKKFIEIAKSLNETLDN